MLGIRGWCEIVPPLKEHRPHELDLGLAVVEVGSGLPGQSESQVFRIRSRRRAPPSRHPDHLEAVVYLLADYELYEETGNGPAAPGGRPPGVSRRRLLLGTRCLRRLSVQVSGEKMLVAADNWRLHMTPTNPGAIVGITTKVSQRSFEETVAKLTELIQARGMKLFPVIDQSAEARSVGLELRPTILVIFGNPVAGTAVMDAAPLAALDLPLKVLVWADVDGVKVSYFAPSALAERYNLAPDVTRNLAGIEPLTDTVVER